MSTGNSFGAYAEAKTLDFWFGGVAMTAPVTCYIAAFLSDPLETGLAGEITGNGYTRVAYTCNLTNWPAASGSSGPTVKSNANQITFPTATPLGWGAIGWWGYFDASSGGNLVWHGTLATPTVSTAGNAVYFPVGALTVGID